MSYKSGAGFTLIELLIVIGIVAILSTVVVLTLSPAQLLTQSRDTRRLSEILSIDKALALAITQSANLGMGLSDRVYLSLPDIDGNGLCNEYSSLPPLAAPWQYVCTASSTLRKVDGTGWVPVNFMSLPIQPLDNIPPDPVNDGPRGFYYSYVTSGGSWELNTQMESKKYEWNGSADVESNDGGNTIVLYERGSNLNLMPKEVNARIISNILIPDSCADTVVTNALIITTDKIYTRWTIPGSGKAALLGLWYRQFSIGEPAAGEVFEMAFYNDNLPRERLSEVVDVVAVGTAGSWASSTMQVPIGINLGQTYIVGIGPDADNPSLPGNRVGRELGNCAGYEPNGGVTGGYLNLGLGPLGDVAGGTAFGTPQFGLVGISYAQN